MFPQFIPYLLNMHNMILHCGAIYQNVIQKDEHKFSEEWTQNVIHDILESGWGIGKPKRHYPELVVALVGLESCFVFILQQHPDLVITGPHVKFCKELGPK